MATPLRVAIAAAEPSGSDGYRVVAPDLGGFVATDLDVLTGESVWLRPHDHSGLPVTVAITVLLPEA